MRALASLLAPAFVATVLLGALTGCGEATTLPQTPSATPFKAGTVAIVQQGNAAAAIDTSSVTFTLDDSRSLVIHLNVRSSAPTVVTVTIRASLYDPSHNLIGDAVGGQISVQPGQPAAVELTGPTPLGTIASVTFEVTAQAQPT
jgi:hypothetical protein